MNIPVDASMAGIFHSAEIFLLYGAGICIMALLVDGKFIFQGFVGVFSARLPEAAPESDHRRVRNNRIKWLLALPLFMLLSLKRMRLEHQAIAREKGLTLGLGYRMTAAWHIFWLIFMGIGFLSAYLGIGAFIYWFILRLAV